MNQHVEGYFKIEDKFKKDYKKAMESYKKNRKYTEYEAFIIFGVLIIYNCDVLLESINDEIKRNSRLPVNFQIPNYEQQYSALQKLINKIKTKASDNIEMTLKFPQIFPSNFESRSFIVHSIFDYFIGMYELLQYPGELELDIHGTPIIPHTYEEVDLIIGGYSVKSVDIYIRLYAKIIILNNLLLTTKIPDYKAFRSFACERLKETHHKLYLPDSNRYLRDVTMLTLLEEIKKTLEMAVGRLVAKGYVYMNKKREKKEVPPVYDYSDPDDYPFIYNKRIIARRIPAQIDILFETMKKQCPIQIIDTDIDF
jgi:hypothetical protein